MLCRGIGLGLVKRFLSRDNTVVATTRSASSAQHLHELRQQYGSKLHITELDTAQPESIQQWAETLAGSIKHVDVSRLSSMQWASWVLPAQVGPGIVHCAAHQHHLAGLRWASAPSARWHLLA